MIYLDHNATTAPAPEVVQAMLNVMQSCWANASSQHGPGQDAKRVLSAARATVARVLGCKPVEVVFTSGATEANQLAVRGLLAASETTRQRVLFGSVEHSAHLRLAQSLGAGGVQVDYLPVLPDGTLDLAAAAALMGPDVALVSLMAANNETGALMPTAEIARMAHAVGALLHVDATQVIGKRPFDFAASGADAVSLSARRTSCAAPRARARWGGGAGWTLRRSSSAGRNASAAAAPRTCPPLPAWRRPWNCWAMWRWRPSA